MRASILPVFLTVLWIFIHKPMAFGQLNAISSDSSFRVTQVICVGNNRTKQHIITRELPFKQGDTLYYNDTSRIFTRSRQNIFNTKLFNEVSLTSIKSGDNGQIIIIRVSERWYFWPIPIFELADRNVNEWIQERGADFSRINIGIDFQEKNFRGRNEQLRFKIQYGFTQKYEVFYQIPYIDKKRKTGIDFSISYSTNKQVAYTTQENKLVYLEEEEIIRTRFYTGVGLVRRNNLYLTQSINTKYHSNWIGDTLAVLNPDYFEENKNAQQFVDLRYTINHDKRDFKFYAIKGHYTSLELLKSGLGLFGDLNLFTATASQGTHVSISEKFSFSNLSKIKFSIPNKRPYSNNKALGYQENFVRGYELYVIDGNHYALNRQEIKYRLLKITSNLEHTIGVSQFNKVPLMVFIKGYYDLGWANDLNFGRINPELNKKLLLGYGIGLDFVSYYDVVIRCEYSFNNLGENGFFLHFGTAF